MWGREGLVTCGGRQCKKAEAEALTAEAEALADPVRIRGGGREGPGTACLSRRGSGDESTHRWSCCDSRGSSSGRGSGDEAGKGLKAAGTRSSVGRENRLVGTDCGRWS